MPNLDDRDPAFHYCNVDSRCSYFNQLSFNTTFKSDNASLKLFHLNVRSTSKNFDELMIFLHSLKTSFHVIVLTETWLNDPAEFLDVAGFRAYHSVRTGKRGGGVSVLVRDDLKSQLLPQFTLVNQLYEMCSVCIKVASKQYNILGLYRPPENSIVAFNQSFFNLISSDAVLNNFHAIIGDFNVDIGAANPPDSTQSFISEFTSLHFIPAISVPTRVHNHSKTVLDHIWLNSVSTFSSGVFPVHISDHFPIFICVSNVFKQSEKEMLHTKFRCHSEANLQKFAERVSLLVDEFPEVEGGDVNVLCENFHSTLYKAYHETCPIKTKYISAKRLKNPWLSDELLSSISRKHEIYRLCQRDSQYLPLFKRYRNALTTAIRDAKKKYFSEKLNSCSGDVKKTWRSINSILRPNARQNNGEVSEVDIDGNCVSDPVLIAAEFNKHYTSVARKLANKIPPTNSDPTLHVPNLTNSFVFFPTNSGELQKVIHGFKSKSSDLYTIPSFIYKHVSNLISPIVSKLINNSFSRGIFPNVLKVARVIPIYKSGEKNIVSNYRPISTLHFLGKVFEKVIFNRLSSFLNKYDLINCQQFGFRRGRSTSDAMLNFTDAIYDTFNESKFCISVLLDFSKAFDTVNHEILLRKLYLLGIRSTSLQWFKSYLHDRKQYVCINSSCSPTLSINTGVPQGSILGPLLFILYINDMCKSSSELSFVHFADDTTVFRRGCDLDELYTVVNRELTCVDTWLRANKLSLNINKTTYMIFSNKSKVSDRKIFIRNIDVSRVTSAKFLGIFIDESLNFKDHIQYVINRVSRSSAILRNLSLMLPQHVLKKIYFSLVYPFLIYGVEVWGNSSRTLLGRLARMQNRCIRHVSRRFSVNILDVYRFLKLLPLHDIYAYFTILKFFRYYILQTDYYFISKFNSFQVNHDQNTRSKVLHLLHAPKVTKSRCFNSFVYNSVILWNEIPVALREINSYFNFKHSIRAFLLNKET